MPIIGGPFGELGSRYHANTSTCSAAVKLKGESRLADFPVLLDNPLICNGIMQSRHFRTISACWDNLDVAPVGIGSPVTCDGANWYTSYGGEENDDLNIRQVVGNICSRFLDIHDAMVEASMSEETFPIEMNKLKQARYSASIAVNEERYNGTVSVLYREYTNCPVMNSSTVELLLKQKSLRCLP